MDRVARIVDNLQGPILGKNFVSRHLLREMPQLVENGIFSEVDKHSTRINVPLFKVPKSGAMNSRLIGDCRALNKLLPRPGDMRLPLIERVLFAMLEPRFLFQRDGKSFFYQFELHESFANVLCSKVGDQRGLFKTFRWNVLPMGFSFAPGIAQHTSLAVSQAAVAKHPGSTLIPLAYCAEGWHWLMVKIAVGRDAYRLRWSSS